MSRTKPPSSLDDVGLLGQVKDRIRQSQVRAVFAVNAALIWLYWDIGRILDAQQDREGYGAAVIPRLARDVRNEIPEAKGFSERNLGRMVAFSRAYPDPATLLPQPVAKPMVKADDVIRLRTDISSIGMILCQNRNKVEAECTIQEMNKPSGVLEYELTRVWPGKLRPSLATIETIEAGRIEPMPVVAALDQPTRKEATKR